MARDRRRDRPDKNTMQRKHTTTMSCGKQCRPTCVVATVSVPEDSPHHLRLCHLRRTGGAVGCGGGYGFTVYTATSPAVTGQFVGNVDHHSLAERAGLLSGDRIVEVNGVNVETDSHSEVVIFS